MTAQREGYRKLHHWLVNNFGKAHMCEKGDCRIDQPKRFEWALIHGKTYEYNRNNFMMLCPSCHRIYDYEILTEEEKRKFHEWKKGRTPNNIKKIQQFTKDGILFADYTSIKKASDETGILRTAIINNLSELSKSSGGYIFKYLEL